MLYFLYNPADPHTDPGNRKAIFKMAKVKADLGASSYGRIRPLHGVNGGPMTKVFTYDGRPLFRRAGIPICRLHDTEYPYGSGEFVDIPCVFKDFDADENDPANYSFGLTDEYIRAIYEVGAEPIYRLGVSIEHAPVKRYIYPPKDYEKWARICEHVIMHYNSGWADGHEWNIRYWEIWNEPEGKNMWLGTDEEFFEFFEVAARHLKARFPELKIGGPAFTRPDGGMREAFVKYCGSRGVPLDFYSWHRYFIDAENVKRSAAAARTLLDENGYSDTESIFDEWNYMRDWTDQADSYVKLCDEHGAAFCAAVLSSLQQDTDVDAATYFEADPVKEWCGLFRVAEMGISRQKAKLAPRKPFYAFESFGKLYRLGEAVYVSSDCDRITACAARDAEGKNFGLMIANYSSARGGDEKTEIELEGVPSGRFEVRLTDAAREDEVICGLECEGSLKLTLDLKENSFVYIGSAV